MEKQKKNLDIKSELHPLNTINLETRSRSLVKRFIKSYISSSPKYFDFISIFYDFPSTAVKYILTVNVKQNNLFCTFSESENKQFLLCVSAGSYKLNMSKKKHRFLSKIILKKFLNNVRKFLQASHIIIIINLISPARLRVKLVRQLRKALVHVQPIFNFKKAVCFNGCKSKKAKKKKRKGFRIFK